MMTTKLDDAKEIVVSNVILPQGDIWITGANQNVVNSPVQDILHCASVPDSLVSQKIEMNSVFPIDIPITCKVDPEEDVDINAAESSRTKIQYRNYVRQS